jgi:hypothetical protein
MKCTKNKNVVYKSFEQFRADLFPDFVNAEEIKLIKNDTEKLGACLADKAIEKILQDKSISSAELSHSN